jgi:LL-diaminopimelate aminotransferase
MTFDGYKPPSFLSMPGAKEVGIELNSLSKPFNMTGWRIGLAAGCPEVIQTMAAVKSNVDSGQFNAIQTAAVAALSLPLSHYEHMNELYEQRRDFLIAGFNRLGWQLEKTKATFYLWIPAPEGYTGASFAEKLLDQAGIIATPGSGYGQYGEAFFRIALTVPEERLQLALERIQAII